MRVITAMHGGSRPKGLADYNRIQCALMARFFARGGSLDDWSQKLAPAFRKRYGWILEATHAEAPPVAVPPVLRQRFKPITRPARSVG